MARPIPYINLSGVSRFAELKPTPIEEKDVDKPLDRKKGSSNNLVLGTISGWAAGIAVVRVGKVAAFGLGGGVLLLHFAHELGYIEVNWEQIRDSATMTQVWMDKCVRFVKNNSCYSMGFIGGFFFGVAAA